MKTPLAYPFALGLSVFLVLGACERHEWEDTKQLHDHGQHVEHDDQDAGHGVEPPHGDGEARPAGEAGVAEEGEAGAAPETVPTDPAGEEEPPPAEGEVE